VGPGRGDEVGWRTKGEAKTARTDQKGVRVKGHWGSRMIKEVRWVGDVGE
jgi:hypothetical protein